MTIRIKSVFEVTHLVCKFSLCLSIALSLPCCFFLWYFHGAGLAISLYCDVLVFLIVFINVLGLFQWTASSSDPLDPLYPFLAYFFVIFSVPAVCIHWFDFDTAPILKRSEIGASSEVQALVAILLSLCGVVLGNALPVGKLSLKAPFVPSSLRLIILGAAGVLGGYIAFAILINDAGGLMGFWASLGAWRTVGVLDGTGYLMFAITGLLPLSLILLLIATVKFRGRVKGVPIWLIFVVISAAALLPVLALGFRIVLVPTVFEILVIWHCLYRRISRRQMLCALSVLFCFLAGYGGLRDQLGRGEAEGSIWSRLIFRVAGVHTVERVVYFMESGVPTRGVASAIVETSSIVFPRKLWAGKPTPASLSFAELFFDDFFVTRGDPIGGVRSGVSPTLTGEFLWIGGIWLALGGSIMLGLLARIILVVTNCGGQNIIKIMLYSVFCGCFPVFVEAPQNAMNSIMILTAMSGILVICMLPVARSAG